MGLDFKDETFREDFTFFNSPEAIRRFPFPFPEDSYMYSVNMEPHVPGRPGSVFEKTFDVDEHYVAEMRERARVLAEDPLRCQSLPHMTLAGWDLLELIMEAKARELQTIVSIHAAQNPIEISRVKAAQGVGSIEHLRNLGLLRPGVVLAHGMFATDAEFAMIAAEGAALASCTARGSSTRTSTRCSGAGKRPCDWPRKRPNCSRKPAMPWRGHVTSRWRRRFSR